MKDGSKVAAGMIGGKVRSEAKILAARQNGQKGGRPRKVTAPPKPPKTSHMLQNNALFMTFKPIGGGMVEIIERHGSRIVSTAQARAEYLERIKAGWKSC